MWWWWWWWWEEFEDDRKRKQWPVRQEVRSQASLASCSPRACINIYIIVTIIIIVIIVIIITLIFTMIITITTISVSPSPPPMKMQVAVEFRVRLRFPRMTGTSHRDSTWQSCRYNHYCQGDEEEEDGLFLYGADKVSEICIRFDQVMWQTSIFGLLVVCLACLWFGCQYLYLYLLKMLNLFAHFCEEE